MFALSAIVKVFNGNYAVVVDLHWCLKWCKMTTMRETFLLKQVQRLLKQLKVQFGVECGITVEQQVMKEIWIQDHSYNSRLCSTQPVHNLLSFANNSEMNISYISWVSLEEQKEHITEGSRVSNGSFISLFSAGLHDILITWITLDVNIASCFVFKLYF